ncbi:MAG: hypothetical protein AAFU71_08940, partial [Cyanobacteria bacterium J06632_22]
MAFSLFSDRLCRRAVMPAAVLVAMATARPVGATPPEQARVDNILGNSSELLIRRSSARALLGGAVISASLICCSTDPTWMDSRRPLR